MANDEDQWIDVQRKDVERYLAMQKVDHAGVAEYPAFHVFPHIALWAVQSRRSPGWIGWWAISGDFPTDCISAIEGRHPRDALRVFARHWQELSGFILRGEEHPDYCIGTPEQWPELGDLLRRRAEILQGYAKDEIWSDESD